MPERHSNDHDLVVPSKVVSGGNAPPPPSENNQPPPFEPLDLGPIREGKAYVPSEVDSNPASLLKLFFCDEILDLVVKCSNKNAWYKRMGRTESGGQRPWSPLTKWELLRYLGILSYMGLYPVPRIADYWTTDEKSPQHPSCKVPLCHSPIRAKRRNESHNL